MTKVDCEIWNVIFREYGVDVRGIRYPGLISWKSPVSGGTTDYAVDFFMQHFLLIRNMIVL